MFAKAVRLDCLVIWGSNMSMYVGVVSSGPSVSITLNQETLVSRIANLLRRSDINSEIEQWLNFVQRDMANHINFPALRVSVEALLVPMPLAPVTTPSDSYYLDLPADYNSIDRVYYRNTTDANNVWGRNLVPLPRQFYAGDVVDFERLLNTSVPSVGDPYYYWLDGNSLGVYPALANNLTGKIQLHYYRLPVDMTAPSHEPEVPNNLRHYMIPLAILWGKILTAQSTAEVAVLGFWEKKYKTVMKDVEGMVHEDENPREVLTPPSNGMERADEVY